MYKTTHEKYKYFKDRVLYYAKELGLPYEFHFDLRELGDSRAAVRVNLGGTVVEVGLNSEWDDYEPGFSELDRCAYHEVLEVLLYTLRSMASLYLNRDIVDAEIHKVVRVLENIRFGYEYGTSMTREDDGEEEA